MSLRVLLPQASDVPLWHHHGGEHGSGVPTSALQLSPLTPRPFWRHRPPVGGAGSPGGQAEGPSQPSLGDESRGVRTRAKRRLCRSRSETSDSAWASRWPRCSSHQTTQTTQFFPPSSAASSAHSGKWRVYTCPSGWGGAKFSINENKCDELENKSALRIFSPLLWLDSKKKPSGHICQQFCGFLLLKTVTIHRF